MAKYECATAMTTIILSICPVYVTDQNRSTGSYYILWFCHCQTVEAWGLSVHVIFGAFVSNFTSPEFRQISTEFHNRAIGFHQISTELHEKAEDLCQSWIIMMDHYHGSPWWIRHDSVMDPLWWIHHGSTMDPSGAIMDSPWWINDIIMQWYSNDHESIMFTL